MSEETKNEFVNDVITDIKSYIADIVAFERVPHDNRPEVWNKGFEGRIEYGLNKMNPHDLFNLISDTIYKHIDYVEFY